MTLAPKKIITPLVLISFLVLALFSFSGMAYGPDGSMQGDCPFSVAGASLCPPSALPGAIHHLSAYQSFINVPINFNITALIVSLLITVSIAFVFLFHIFLYKIPIFVPYSPTPFTSEDKKIKRWLSLFENSPSR